jgi:hypothetical protein
MQVEAVAGARPLVRVGPTATRHRWTWAHYLAILGSGLLFLEVWTVSSWLAHGPTTVTGLEDRSSAAWIGARVFEGIIIVVAIVVIPVVIRSSWRSRRLTFDAMLVIAGALTYWVDPFVNWVQPLFFYNSNWVNLKNWCGNMPLIANPDCGRLPEPVLFVGLVYTVGFLVAGIGVNSVMRKVLQRRPSISMPQMYAVAFVAGMLVDFFLEYPMVLLHLWGYPGWPLSFTGGAAKFPLFESLGTGLFFANIAMIRFYKDDNGRTLVERGLDHVRPALRKWISLLALLGFISGSAFATNGILSLNGPYMQRYQKEPPALINRMCDAPGTTGTAYGPCPGSPGYRAPIRRLTPGGAG